MDNNKPQGKTFKLSKRTDWRYAFNMASAKFQSETLRANRLQQENAKLLEELKSLRAQRAIPRVDTEEARLALAAMDKEYGYPCNPANCARYGWEAARRYASRLAAPAHEPGLTEDKAIHEKETATSG